MTSYSLKEVISCKNDQDLVDTKLSLSVDNIKKELINEGDEGNVPEDQKQLVLQFKKTDESTLSEECPPVEIDIKEEKPDFIDGDEGQKQLVLQFEKTDKSTLSEECPPVKIDIKEEKPDFIDGGNREDESPSCLTENEGGSCKSEKDPLQLNDKINHDKESSTENEDQKQLVLQFKKTDESTLSEECPPVEIDIKEEKPDSIDGDKSSNVQIPIQSSSINTSENVINDDKKTTISKKLYKCPFCEKLFTQSFNLNHHLRIHTGEKPYRCQLCNQAFRRSDTLNDHFLMHMGEKRYQCDQCGKLFSRLSNRNNHLRVHTGDKPYKCQYCEKLFTHISNLNVHLRCHTGEKPYKCLVCEKCFSASKSLKVHLRTHTGEKPYKCQYCDRSFTQLSNLKYHLNSNTCRNPENVDLLLTQTFLSSINANTSTTSTSFLCYSSTST